MYFRHRFACIVLLVFFLGGCEEPLTLQSDVISAQEAIKEQQWIHAERLLDRYLRFEEQPENRWEAWLMLVDVSSNTGASSTMVLSYLENMLYEFNNDSAKKKVILQRAATIYEKLGDFQGAAEAWRHYLELYNLNPQETYIASRKLASIYFQKRRFEDAENVLYMCLTLDVSPREIALCLFDLADVKSGREEWDQAIELAREVLELDIDTTTRGLTTFLLADALQQKEQFAEALRYFELAQEFHPNKSVVDFRIDYVKDLIKKK